MEEKDNDPDTQLDQLEESEETLSFCDLPIYSAASAAAAEWESSSSSSDQDFEFFCEEWSNSSTFPVHQNIVFCGKLFPLQESISHTTQNPRTQKQNPKKSGFFQWNSTFFRRTSNSVSLRKCGYNKVAKGGQKRGFSVGRVSILSAAVKPRWQLMLFGLVRLPTEMELSDIRSRQRRRSPAELFRLSGGDEKVSRGKGLWGLIRSLYTCVGVDATSTAKRTPSSRPEQ